VLEDLSIPELATALGIRRNTATVRVRRAKARLARVYEEEGRATAPQESTGALRPHEEGATA
jgi:RNA polymerase sigma-70 factor (ECF subfamily)